jgi:hypothetical protein
VIPTVTRTPVLTRRKAVKRQELVAKVTLKAQVPALVLVLVRVTVIRVALVVGGALLDQSREEKREGNLPGNLAIRVRRMIKLRAIQMDNF